MNNAVLKKLNGLHIRYRKINPVVAVRNTDKVLDNPYDRWNVSLKAVISIMFKTTVKETGRALLTIFKRKFPVTKSWFGSNARIKEGIPIVKPVISVNWMGTKKYFVDIPILNAINKMV